MQTFKTNGSLLQLRTYMYVVGTLEARLGYFTIEVDSIEIVHQDSCFGVRMEWKGGSTTTTDPLVLPYRPLALSLVFNFSDIPQLCLLPMIYFTAGFLLLSSSLLPYSLSLFLSSVLPPVLHFFSRFVFLCTELLPNAIQQGIEFLD